MLGGSTPELAVTGRRLMALMLEAKLLQSGLPIEMRARAGTAGEPAEVKLRLPASLKFTVPLILLGFAAMLSAVNLLYHVPQAERAAEDDSRKRSGAGDVAVAEHARVSAAQGRCRRSRNTRSRCWRTTTTSYSPR